MNIEVTRPDIESAMNNLMDAILVSLSPEQRLEALEWMIQILQKMQDEVE